MTHDFLKKAPRISWRRAAGIEIHDVTTQWGVYALAGPNARAILLKDIVKDADPDTVLSNKRFPWLSIATSNLACARSARSAWPIPANWAGNCTTRSNSAAICGICWSAGERHGLKPVGARAQNWLRQEKSIAPSATNLAATRPRWRRTCRRFVDLSKDFRGKAKMLDTGIRSKCVTLLIDGPADADPWGKEALLLTAKRSGA
jgi:dimethylglycine dehydrogenase